MVVVVVVVVVIVVVVVVVVVVVIFCTSNCYSSSFILFNDEVKYFLSTVISMLDVKLRNITNVIDPRFSYIIGWD